MTDNSDQHSSSASHGNGNRSGRKSNSRPNSRNENSRDRSTGNKKPSNGPASTSDRDSSPGHNSQPRNSAQRGGNSLGGRRPNDPPPPQARRVSDGGSSSGGDNTLAGSMHAPKGRIQSGGHRKLSLDKNAGGQSTLNPNAGGFQPGALSAIMDVDAEVLITPTASQTQFQNETVKRPPPPSKEGSPVNFLTTLDRLQLRRTWLSRWSERSSGYRTATGDASRTMQAALQAAQAQGAHANAPRYSNVDIMSPMSESYQIQQQLEMLRQQQEALMYRFGDLQTGPTPSQPIHRRGQSVQVGSIQSNVFKSAPTPVPVTSNSASPVRTSSSQLPGRAPPSAITSPTPLLATSTLVWVAALANNGSGAQGHHRGHSKANSISNIGGFNMDFGAQASTDLNQAQMQLQQLAQFRAASGHTMRKSLFAPYLPQASIPPLLAAGRLVIGVMRVNKRNRSDAYVATDTLDSDIYICGSKDRNRALEGDVVAVELLDVDEVWGTKKEKEEKKRKKEENQAFDSRIPQNSNRRDDKKRDDVEVEGQGLTLFEEEEVNDDQRPNFAGHIVAVWDLGITTPLIRPPLKKSKKLNDAIVKVLTCVAVSVTSNVPRLFGIDLPISGFLVIAIPVDQAPADFLADPNKYSTTFSLLVSSLKPVLSSRTATSHPKIFSESVVKCLPALPWTIPEREYEVRRDFRNRVVFTIDGATARDLDDALHISKNEDGTFEVGVHIADVTHFVKPGTALDREARKRATTVYLVQRAVPMLPPTLSEHLCSLSPGQDKLTFSAVFRCRRRSNKSLTGESSTPPEMKIGKEDVSVDQVSDSLRALGQLSGQMRVRRFEEGCLRIDNIRLNIQLDEEGLPDDCSVVLGDEAKQLVEEFMLLANSAVAKKIAAGLPEQAMLRRHEAPIDRRLEGFAKRAAKMGFEVDTSSAGALMKSMNSMRQAGKASHFVLQLLSTKAMVKAKYFCGGALDIAKWSHYALNLPVYTHFTSPIRRFADVMVHRQLEAVLSSACDVNQHGPRYGPVIRSANVIGVLDEAFDVAVPDFGIEKRVHVDQMR
ncbi:hypothetical protein KEM48_001986 [Puccinia striiformis f. sp. tritici PST-130]|nr:hypothetical protein KEM48_001986 [Puccinia striiformis f. sp. tritici PST-130]